LQLINAFLQLPFYQVSLFCKHVSHFAIHAFAFILGFVQPGIAYRYSLQTFPYFTLIAVCPYIFAFIPPLGKLAYILHLFISASNFIWGGDVTDILAP